jgi:hypothetical protein
MVNASGPHDAKLQAIKMLKDDLTYAIIWRGPIQVATVLANRTSEEATEVSAGTPNL